MIYNILATRPRMGNFTKGELYVTIGPLDRQSVVHTYEVLWSLLRRSMRPGLRQSESGWKSNYDSILKLRQCLIDGGAWERSARDRIFDRKLQSSLMAQLRLAVISDRFSVDFARQLLAYFRDLVVDRDLMCWLKANGIHNDTIDEHVLNHIFKVEAQAPSLPDRIIIDSVHNLLRLQLSLA